MLQANADANSEECRDEGYGEEDFQTDVDFESLREDIRRAKEDCDEVKLSVAVDLAKELGSEYPYQIELDEAEDYLYELMQCPVTPSENMFTAPSAHMMTTCTVEENEPNKGEKSRTS